jgi:hypothetical protein
MPVSTSGFRILYMETRKLRKRLRYDIAICNFWKGVESSKENELYGYLSIAFAPAGVMSTRDQLDGLLRFLMRLSIEKKLKV